MGAAGVLLVGWWVLRRLVVLAVVAVLLVGAVVWANHPGARHHVQSPVSRQLHKLGRNARHDVTRVIRHDARKVARQHH